MDSEAENCFSKSVSASSTEKTKEENVEASTCTCSHQISSTSSGTNNSYTVCASLDTCNHFRDLVCKCHAPQNMVAELTTQRNDYLRQNVMVPLTWAMSRALRYGPSDPTHYIAYQLLRWKYADIPREEKDSVRRFVASATRTLDRKLAERYKPCSTCDVHEQELQSSTESVPCSTCGCQESYEAGDYWNSEEKSSDLEGPCEFPEMCGSCRIRTADAFPSASK